MSKVSDMALDEQIAREEAELLAEFRKCLCAISFTRAGRDFYDMPPMQQQSEATSGARNMAQARTIWADNPNLHDDLRTVFKELDPLATMDEIERAQNKEPS